VEHEYFKAFVDGVRREIARRASEEDTARGVRGLLRECLTRGPFLLDCVEGAIDTMNGPPDPPWANPPICEDQEYAFSIRTFYWAPGFANRAHRHDEWTVTGVLHNALTFLTYADTPNGLVVERRIEALARDVGYIASPCIHNVSNDSQDISASLHVFSGVRPDDSQRRTQWYGEDVPARSARAGEMARALKAFVALARGIDHPRRLPVLERLFSLGDPPIKLLAAKAIAPLDGRLAAQRLSELAMLCSASVAEELNRLSHRLRAHARIPERP
jgi:predicted metal-dependent enzyme (double-stranded beta helix superfamily)